MHTNGGVGDLYSHAELLSCGDYPYRTKGARAVRRGPKAMPCCRCDGSADSKISILRYRAWRLLRTFVFLILLGTTTSIFAWSLDRACAGIQSFRVELIDMWVSWKAEDVPPGANGSAVTFGSGSASETFTATEIAIIVAQCGLFIGVSVMLALFALGLIAFVESAASGSGIPQMKAVLNGDRIFPGFTTIRCLVVKLLGLMCSWTSGLSVGKEGPFVHISCCIAAILMRVPAFSFYAHSAPHRIGMLGISSAVGVAAVFGSPLGGVLFAIEVVSTFFRVSNLPRMFVSAVVGALAIKTFGYYEGWPLALFSTQFEPKQIDPSATLFFLILGIFQGFLAGLFIVAVKMIVRCQNRRVDKWCGTSKPLGGGPWWCCSASQTKSEDRDLITAATPCRRCIRRSTRRCHFFGRHAAIVIPVVILECALSIGLHRSVPSAAKQKNLINILFDEKQVSQIRLSTIFTLGVSKFILTALCCSLPLPSGLFTPVFTIGALIGRLFGQGVTAISAAYFHHSISFSAGEFAVAGAAAFAGGVTRSIATAAIVMELTGQLHLQIPVAVCVLASYFVSNRFASAVYDVLIKEHGLP